MSRPIPKSAKLGVAGAIAVIIAGVVLLPMAKGKDSGQRLVDSGQGTAKKADFSTTLANGVTVKILGITNYPVTDDSKWWSIDGTVLDKGLLSRADRRSMEKSNFGKEPNRRHFVVVGQTENPKDITVLLSAKSLSGPEVYVPFSTGGSKTTAYVISATDETIASNGVCLTAKVADGKWETVEKFTVGGDSGTTSKGGTYSVFNAGWGKTTLTLNHVGELSGKDFESRTAAFDEAGKVYPGRRGNLPSVPKDCTASGLPLVCREERLLTQRYSRGRLRLLSSGIFH